MFIIPPEFTELISIFSSSFTKKTFVHCHQLLLGLILTRGKRTVCSVLRTLGLSQVQNWSVYHKVLSRNKWSALKCSKQLARLLVSTFAAKGEIPYVHPNHIL